MAEAAVYHCVCARGQIPVTWVNHYLRAEYCDGAREWMGSRYDCWALCREVRHLYCGKRLLDSWGGLRNTMPREFTAAYKAESASMVMCEPSDGAIAAVFRGKLCVHVGVVISIDGDLRVLDINPNRGPRLQRVNDFEREYLRVEYWND